jgi:hypothetical protein
MKNDKKAFLRWLKDEGTIVTDGNLISAERAFFANSVFCWYVEEVKKGTMSRPQIENCAFILRKFLKGKLDLCWDDGIIKVRKKRSKKGVKNASSGMANTNGEQKGV